MELHQIASAHPGKRPRARIGRGGKRGTTAGRGTKGQNSRAGHRIRPAERDFIQHIPKLRGFKNKPVREKAFPVNLKVIAKRFTGEIVNPATLREARIVRKASRIKILGEGILSRPLTFQGVEISKSAKAKIEAAGGIIK